MKTIKCFVSMRTDMENVNVVDNPLYIPIFCGASSYNGRNKEICRDDTGANISDKKEYLSEFTVQYWAWKNASADYIGLCHYRRYLAFHMSPIIPRETDGLYRVPYFNRYFMDKMGINQEKCQREVIEQYDLLVNEAVNVFEIPDYKGYYKTVYELWKTQDGKLLDANYIDYMLEVIKQTYPDIYEISRRYLYGTKHRGYNCYIMKKDIFDGLNDFQFSVLKQLEDYVTERSVPLNIKRTYAFIGEILYGIYIEYLSEKKEYKIKELPLVWISNTYKGNESKLRSMIGLTMIWLSYFMRKIWNMVLPCGSKRRMMIVGLRRRMGNMG